MFIASLFVQRAGTGTAARRASRLGLGLLTAVVAQAAWAQGAVLEEILVTATRRAETDIQTTPVAVTPVGEQDIERLIPRDLLDVAAYAPNVSAGKQPGFNSANFAIRGVGQNGIILYFENQVGVTVDDFVIPHIQTANIEMLDIERVEILRGPQGTLFGKNTTGGVINVKTKRPDLEQGSLDLRGKFASFGRYEGQAIVNVPFAEKFAFRAAALYMNSDGFYRNGAKYGPVGDLGVGYPLVGATGQGDGSKVGGDDVFSGRFKLRWQPTDNLDINFAYEIVRDDGDSPPSVNGTPPNSGYLWNVLGFTQDEGDPVEVAAITNREDNLLQMGSRGHEIDVDGFYLNVDWRLNDDYTVVGFVGRRETDSWLPSTYTGEVGPVSLFDANRQDERETTQLEFRIASDLEGPINWLAGFFYQKDETIFTVAQTLGFVDMTLDSATIFGDPLFFNNNPQVLSNGQDAESWAIYGDATWNVNDRFTVGAGLRFTHEEKDWTGRNQVFIQALGGGFDPNFTWRELGEPLAAADFDRFPFGVVHDSQDWDEPTWRLTASYQLTDDLFTYFTYARGFKSGGYNDQTGTGGNPIEPIQARPTDPETADSFELGLRSDLLDNTLRFNLTGFYVKYDDSQQQLLATISADRDGDGINESTFQETRFFNAASIEVFGIEVESTWRATEHFTARGSLGWLDASFDKFQADTDFDGTIDTDLSGNDVARAPEITANLDLLVNHSAFNGELEWAANINYEDEAVYAYTSVADTPDGLTDSRTLLNGSITYRPNDGNWWLRIYGKNLSDERYRIGELPVATLWVMSFYGEPRSFGIEGGVGFTW
ncbi:MAG: TonB-dependent receptor [Gammaproteobacteria bacterium]|nr:MAG: TonB-dependent receptor [Gammaproteobacteria bacterium]